MITVNTKRPLFISGGLAGMLLIVGWYYDPLTYAPLCLLAVLWQVLRGLYYALRRNWAALKLCGLRLLIWLIAMACLIVAHNFNLKETQKRADVLLSALQSYRAREGRFPPSLDALVPRDVAVLPLVARAPSRLQPFRYRVQGEAGDHFMLMFESGFRLQHTYDSTTAHWTLRD